MAMTLTSPAFADGELIPRQFTCDGENIPPPLEWSAGPAGIGSFALTVEDPDAPRGTFTHWVLYDIPAHAVGWPFGEGGKTLRNDFGRSGYGGPCPPRGKGAHRYVFTIHAIDVGHLRLAGDRLEDLRAELATHTLDTGRLVGRYGR